MSAALRRLRKLDADRVELTEALCAFTRRSTGADVSLVFYTGHGIEMNGVTRGGGAELQTPHRRVAADA